MANQRLLMLFFLSMCLFLLGTLFTTYTILWASLPVFSILFITLVRERIIENKVSINRKISTTETIEGAEIVVELKINNHTSKIEMLEILDVLPDFCEVIRGSNHFFVTLDENEEVTIKYSFSFPRRGYYDIGPIKLRQRDLLGFYEHEYSIDDVVQVLITPYYFLIERNLEFHRKLKGVIGEVRTKLAGQGDTLHGFKEYEAGDDFRFINWKILARHNQLMVQQHQWRRCTKILLVLDSSGGTRNYLDIIVRATLSLAHHFVKHHSDVGMIIHKDLPTVIKLGNGKRHLTEITMALSKVRVEPIKRPSMRIKQIIELVPRGTLIIFISALQTTSAVTLARSFGEYRGSIVIVPSFVLSEKVEHDYEYVLLHKLSQIRNASYKWQLEYSGVTFLEWNLSVQFKRFMEESTSFRSIRSIN